MIKKLIDRCSLEAKQLKKDVFHLNVEYDLDEHYITNDDIDDEAQQLADDTLKLCKLIRIK